MRKDNFVFSRVDSVKINVKALAILFDIKFYEKRAGSKIKEDLNLDTDEGNDLIIALDKGGFIRPNPHRNVDNINYVLTEKGIFLINEVKAENPELLNIFEN